MIAATILAASLGASAVISNDDWPRPTKDNLDTCSAEVRGTGWFAEYHMLTTIANGRTDWLEAGYLWPGLPVGLYARVAGDLGGRWAQEHWHHYTGGNTPPLGWGSYNDPTRLDAGVWVYHTVGPLTLDGRATARDAYARVDAAWSVDWAGCTWTGGAFARAWVDHSDNETAAEVHRALGRVGLCGRVTVDSTILTLQLAANDVRGGIGWAF